MTEGFIAAGAMAIGGCALIAGFYELNKDESAKSIIDRLLTWFAYSGALWALAVYVIFSMKIPSYRPSLFLRRLH
jgi:hypothetical protein